MSQPTTLQTITPLRRQFAGNEGNQPVLQVCLYDNLVLDPPYQRDSVWAPLRQCLLIRSLLTGTPTGMVFLNVRPDDVMTIAVVDGKQRIEAVLAFVRGDLPVPASWFLPGDAPVTVDTPDGPYARYPDLTDRGQRMFERATFVTMRTNLDTIAEKADLFSTVNFTGVAQGDTDLSGQGA